MVARRWALASAAGIVVVVLAVAVALVWSSAPSDPLSVVRAWNAARNAGDVDRAMSLVAEDANLFGVPADESGRAWHRAVLEGQAIAGHRVEDSECRVSGSRVICRYAIQDAFLRKCGLTLTGTHRFEVRNGLIDFAARDHDSSSRAAVYAAIRLFRDWVEASRPEVAAVIWSDATSTFYTTPQGATQMLAVLDGYGCPPGG
jgi:hypothetical protein